MTFDEIELLSLRLDRAIEELDADYSRSQANAEECHVLYQRYRNNATNFHAQRILLLEAKQQLWSFDDEKEEF